MAYVSEDILEDEEGQAGSGGPVLPGSGVSASNAAGGNAQTKKTPGRFADLGEYMRVNQPQNFGSQVAGKIGQDVQKGQQSLGEAIDAFKQRVDENTISDTRGLIGQIGTDPGSINQQDFSKLRDAQYQGPRSISETPDLYGKVEGSAGSALGKAQASNTESGRFALLDSYFGRPTYTQGQKALDNLLIQNDPSARQAFSQVRDDAQALQRASKQAGADLMGYAGSGADTTRATRESARGALGIDDAGNYSGGGAIGSLRGDIDSAVAQRKADQEAQFAQLQNFFEGRDPSALSPELSEAVLGNTSANGGYNTLLDGPYRGSGQKFFWGVDPNQYLSKPELSAGGVATPEQQQRMQALAQLAGLSGDDYLPDASVAGTQDDEALFGFDRGGFNDATRAKHDEWFDAYTAIKSVPGESLQVKNEKIRNLNRLWGLPDNWGIPTDGGTLGPSIQKPGSMPGLY